MGPGKPLRNLGVRSTPDGGVLRVYSANATAMELCIFDDADLHWVVGIIAMERDDQSVWTGASRALRPGASYTIRADGPRGPRHAFNPASNLIDPYGRALRRVSADAWRSVVPANDAFDWGDVRKPATALDVTVVYEAHLKGVSRLNPGVPEALRGTYAGLGHESTTNYLRALGVTAVELLPVQQFVSEQRLVRQGLSNYWGYNTLSYFAPHAAYATAGAREAGPDAIAREFKGMVKSLHAAGLEVILDVVYNHTAEEARGVRRTSFRGIDNATYYRSREDDGAYIDVTGCGNSLNVAHPVPAQLVLDSLKYWANDMQVDGFRFDLAATLGRNDDSDFDPAHPLLAAIVSDPELAGVKMIAEPWDVGAGGWQTGNFPSGFLEWNDRYRDRVRDFWLSDIKSKRYAGTAHSGIGPFATRLAGSANTFAHERGPLASLNFVTAHDGFTLADLTVHDHKHNVGNGESNRDGTNDNHSFNHGVEGWSDDREVLRARLRSMRNLLGTLLMSAGVPMITAGDEFGRSQHGNNNAYCHDSEMTWLSWDRAEWQKDLQETTRRLLTLRRENPALRPSRFGVPDASTPSASQMYWFNAKGNEMDAEYWNSPDHRTLQYLAASTPEREPFNRILLVVHGLESTVDVLLPHHDDVASYTLLWDSAVRMSRQVNGDFEPGTAVAITGPSLRLYRANGGP